MRNFVDRQAMIAAAEADVRAEAKRHPDDPWTPDRDKRWASRHGRQADVATAEYSRAVQDARKRLRAECLAERAEQVVKASYVRDRWQAEGRPVPLWAQNTLNWAANPEKVSELYFDENDDVDLDKALAVLNRAMQ